MSLIKQSKLLAITSSLLCPFSASSSRISMMDMSYTSCRCNASQELVICVCFMPLRLDHFTWHRVKVTDIPVHLSLWLKPSSKFLSLVRLFFSPWILLHIHITAISLQLFSKYSYIILLISFYNFSHGFLVFLIRGKTVGLNFMSCRATSDPHQKKSAMFSMNASSPASLWEGGKTSKSGNKIVLLFWVGFVVLSMLQMCLFSDFTKQVFFVKYALFSSISSHPSVKVLNFLWIWREGGRK